MAAVEYQMLFAVAVDETAAVVHHPKNGVIWYLADGVRTGLFQLFVLGIVEIIQLRVKRR